MNNKKLGISVAIASAVAVIGGSISFAFLWKPKDNIIYPQTGAGTGTGTGTETGTTTIPSIIPPGLKAKPSKLKNLPKTIQELKQLYPYYNSIPNGATGQVLFDALNAIQKQHKRGVGSYSQLWQTYKTAYIDKWDDKDNTIFDLYSEKIGTPDQYTFKPGINQTGGSAPNYIGGSYNREHLIPQSVFGKGSGIHDDAHFVWPADMKINGIRSNFIHDRVKNPSKTGKSLGGNDWKLGTSINSPGDKAFEPDNNFKGDVARAYFYFQLTWHNHPQSPKGTWASKIYTPFARTFPYFQTNFLTEYKNWSASDPVDQFNFDSNKAIAKAQGGLRNPFTDMPALINLIWA